MSLLRLSDVIKFMIRSLFSDVRSQLSSSLPYRLGAWYLSDAPDEVDFGQYFPHSHRMIELVCLCMWP
jgi:hypothetical protein